MNIGVDAGCLGEARDIYQTGVYQVVYHILKNLFLLDTTNEYTLYSYSPIPSSVLSEFPHRVCTRVLTPRFLWSSVRLSAEMCMRRPDVFLGFGQSLPLLRARPSFVFLYDIAFELFPACYPDTRARLSRQTRFAVSHADTILAISHATKHDAVRFFGVSDEKIVVLPLGVDPVFSPRSDQDISRVKRKYGIRGPYFFSVGSLRAIKNLSRIVSGFERFITKNPSSAPLVFSGSEYQLDHVMRSRIRHLQKTGYVRLLGFVERGDLAPLYSGALAFISPSLYEGFGLPLLEALACGCPVLYGRGGAQEEVVGRAGIVVDPLDVSGIALSFDTLFHNSALRRSLISLGIRRAANFSWMKTAAGLFALLESVRKEHA